MPIPEIRGRKKLPKFLKSMDYTLTTGISALFEMFNLMSINQKSLLSSARRGAESQLSLDALTG